MDALTSDFYKRYAAELTTTSEARYSAMFAHIERAVPPGSSVLDVGAGSGRDVAAMLELGLNAFGVEPNEAMRAKALSSHPSLHTRLRQDALPLAGKAFSDLLPAGFDAVVCSAVLMHLDVAELPNALASLVEQLRPVAASDEIQAAPAILISLPRMDVSRLIGDRDADGRRFHNHCAEEVRRHLADLGLVLEQSVVSDAVYETTRTYWGTLIFRRVK